MAATTASAHLSCEEPTSRPCSLFLAGHCKYGIACRFSHAISSQSAVVPGSAVQAAGSSAMPSRDGGASRGRRGQPLQSAGGGQQQWRSRQAMPLRVLQPAHTSRTWWTSASPSAAGRQFRVMSYNVLADTLAQTHKHELYRSTHPDHLVWARRWSMIRQEVTHLHPDIVCFQEVDHWLEIQSDMQLLGYEGHYAQRSGGNRDGCATFWRLSCFQSIAQSQISFSEYDMRDNVGLTTLLQHKQQQLDSQPLDSTDGNLATCCVAVANIHILFNPKRGDVKIGQLRLLIKHLQQLVCATLGSAAAGHVCCLVMGDMNHQPHSPIYNFMRQGWLDCLKQHRKDMAGTHIDRNPLRVNMSHSRSLGSNLSFQQQQQLQLLQLRQQHANGLLQQQHLPVQQQWQSPLHFNPGQCMLNMQQQYMQLQYMQQQHMQHQYMQQQNMQQQHMQHQYMQQQYMQLQNMQQQQLSRVLPHSLSAPVLTLRRLKSAGWEPEELVMATGGAHGTHLTHCMQQEQQQLRQQKCPVQQQQQVVGVSNSAGMAALQEVDMDLSEGPAAAAHCITQQQQPQTAQVDDKAVDMDLEAPAKAPAQPRSQQQQNPPVLVAKVRYSPAANVSLAEAGDTGGDDMDLSTDPHQQQQLGQGISNSTAAVAAAAAQSGSKSDMEFCDDEQRRRPQHLRWGSDDDVGLASGEDMDLSADPPAAKQQHSMPKSQLSASSDASIVLERRAQGPKQRRLHVPVGCAATGRQAKKARSRGSSPVTANGDSSTASSHAAARTQQQKLSTNHGATLPHKPPTPPSKRQQEPGVQVPSPLQQQSDKLQHAPPPPPPLQKQSHIQLATSRQQQQPERKQQQQQSQVQQQQQQQYNFQRQQQQGLESVLPPKVSNGRARPLWNEQLPAVVGDGIARHSLTLRSCYAELLGSEPEYTSCHDLFFGTVDYIWYTPQAGGQQLKAIAVLLPPAVEQHVLPGACLPNLTVPSDHICLVADFVLRTTAC